MSGSTATTATRDELKLSPAQIYTDQYVKNPTLNQATRMLIIPNEIMKNSQKLAIDKALCYKFTLCIYVFDLLRSYIFTLGQLKYVLLPAIKLKKMH